MGRPGFDKTACHMLDLDLDAVVAAASRLIGTPDMADRSSAAAPVALLLDDL
jgi:hypothetical protein